MIVELSLLSIISYILTNYLITLVNIIHHKGNMKSILNWFVLLVSIASLISSCKSPDSSSSSDNSPSSTSSGLFISIGDSGTLLTSQDGITWTSRTSGTRLDLCGVTYANSTFVAVGRSGTILTSSDGTSWTSRTSGTTQWLYGVSYGKGTLY